MPPRSIATSPAASSGPIIPASTAHPPHVWQVYNEQNIPAFWPNGPSPNKYAGFLHGTADAIRAVDPTAKIMLGGMHGDQAMNGTPSYDFLNLLYNREDFKRWDDFDIVAVHPYGFSTSEITTEIDKVRAVMDDHGDAAAPIWVTEMGWASAFDDDNSKDALVGADSPGSGEHPDRGLEPDDPEARRPGTSAASSGTRGGTRSSDLCTFCGAAGLLNNNHTAEAVVQRLQADHRHRSARQLGAGDILRRRRGGGVSPTLPRPEAEDRRRSASSITVSRRGRPRWSPQPMLEPASVRALRLPGANTRPEDGTK